MVNEETIDPKNQSMVSSEPVISVKETPHTMSEQRLDNTFVQNSNFHKFNNINVQKIGTDMKAEKALALAGELFLQHNWKDLWALLKAELLTPNGRMSRANFFKKSILLFILMFALTSLVLIIASILGEEVGLFLVIILVGILIFTNVAGLMMTIRRLHDLNHSGWMILLSAVPIINLGFIIYVFCAGGTASANKYGPKPQF